MPPLATRKKIRPQAIKDRAEFRLSRPETHWNCISLWQAVAHTHQTMAETLHFKSYWSNTNDLMTGNLWALKQNWSAVSKYHHSFMYGFQNAHYDYDFEIIYVCISLSRTLLKVAKRLQTFLVILPLCYEWYYQYYISHRISEMIYEQRTFTAVFNVITSYNRFRTLQAITF